MRSIRGAWKWLGVVTVFTAENQNTAQDCLLGWPVRAGRAGALICMDGSWSEMPFRRGGSMGSGSGTVCVPCEEVPGQGAGVLSARTKV